MQEYEFGTIFKKLRIKKGLTLGTACQDICSEDKLLKFEQGAYYLDWHTFTKLMQRLGADLKPHYSDFKSQETHRVMRFKQEMKFLLRKRKKHESFVLLEKAENDDVMQQGKALQFLLYAKANLAYLGKEYDRAYDYALNGIKITIPDYNEDEIANYSLEIEEMLLIQQLAFLYSARNLYEKSLDILLKLNSSFNSFYKNNYPFDTLDSFRLEGSILYNISRCIAFLERTDEWLSSCDEGIAFCIKYYDAHYMPLFMANKAYCFFYQKKNDEGIQLMTDAFILFKVFNRNKEISILKKATKDAYGIEIN